MNNKLKLSFLLLINTYIFFTQQQSAFAATYCAPENLTGPNQTICSSPMDEATFLATNPSGDMLVGNTSQQLFTTDGTDYSSISNENQMLVGNNEIQTFMSNGIDYSGISKTNQFLVGNNQIPLFTSNGTDYSGIQKSPLVIIGSNNGDLKTALASIMIDNGTPVSDNNFLVYFGKGNEYDKTIYGYKSVILCGKDKILNQDGCKIYYTGTGSSLGNFGYNIKSISSPIESLKLSRTDLSSTNSIFCALDNSSCYQIDDSKNSVTDYTIPDLLKSNVVSHNNQLIYVGFSNQLNLNPSITFNSTSIYLKVIDNTLLIFDGNELKFYSLLTNTITNSVTLSFPKEIVNSNDGIVYIGENNKIYKIKQNLSIETIEFGQVVTTNLNYNLETNSIVFCSSNSCYSLNLSTNAIKKKTDIITNYNNKNQYLFPIDRQNKTEYIIFD